MQHTLRSPLLLPLLCTVIFASALLLLLPPAAHAAQVTVNMTDSAFTPKNITINAGDTIRWVNNGAMPHTATEDSGKFDSGNIAPGQSFAATFNTAGTYSYYCKLHGGPGGVGMAGTITIVAPNTGTQTNTNTVVNTNTNTNTNTSASGLQAQAQVLLNQIALLKQQLGVSTAAAPGTVALDSSSCPLIGRSLRKGVSGDDVRRLQQFLARDPSIYPEAIASGYYGALTEKAVQRWQVKYNIVSSGSPSTTGYGVVGPRTAAAIALLCTTGSYGGVPGPTTPPPVGGFITVTPISGNSPLLVNVTATVNTTRSCAGATYTLEYGDGTRAEQIMVPTGNCGELSQTYPHTYAYGGTYQIKLSAGSHQTSATVTVNGPPPPQFTPNLPRETFSATPTSGSAPLTVTFAGIVNSNDAGFCAGGCASTLDFGDGSLTSINLPASVGGWLNYSVQHTYVQSGGFRATLYQGGAGPSQPIVGAVTIIVGAGTTQPPTSTTTPDTYAYSPPTITSAGEGSLTFSTSFDLPSACTGYTFSWGDGSAEEIQNDSSSCAQSPSLKTFQHTYANTGDFTLVLKRGPTLGRVDDISLTIR